MSKINYSAQEMWALYEKIPKELQEIIFSEKTDEDVTNICKRNKIENEQKILKLVQNVLLGVLVPENFEKELKEEIKTDKSLSKNISKEVNEIIFLPIEESLKKLYNKQWTPDQKNKDSSSDTYREPII
jgi:hypothetical protein